MTDKPKSAQSEPRSYEWWCASCKVSVEPKDVTYNETHDLRSGGCGFPVMSRPVPPIEWADEWCHTTDQPSAPEASTSTGSESVIERMEKNLLDIEKAAADAIPATADAALSAILFTANRVRMDLNILRGRVIGERL